MVEALLLSGGIDSTAILYWLRPRHAITINYGQAAADAEIHASMAACEAVGVEHHVLHADCSSCGIGIMMKSQGRSGCPTFFPKRPEWWPYRNQLIITLAASLAFRLNVNRLLIGTVKDDRPHGDGKLDFIATMSKLLRLQEGGLELCAPAIELESVDLVKASEIPNSILSWTHSCHVSAFACGVCRGCQKHRLVLEQLGL